MTGRDIFYASIRETWGEGAEASLAKLIVDLVEQDLSASYIPLARFHRLAKERELDAPQVVERVIQYLLGAESHVLELGAELVEGDEVTRLGPEEFSLASNLLIHPLTGVIDEALPSKIFVYVYPSELARATLRRQGQ